MQLASAMIDCLSSIGLSHAYHGNQEEQEASMLLGMKNV